MTTEQRRIAVVLVTVGLSAMLATPSHAQSYDLVINGGRVIDPETMYDAIANVGVKGGRIAVITKDTTGKETIDARGLVVAPGFSDTHWHAVEPFGTKLGLADGITTGLDLETGGMPIK